MPPKITVKSPAPGERESEPSDSRKTKGIARIPIKKKLVTKSKAKDNKSDKPPTIIKGSREDIEGLIHSRLYDKNPNEKKVEPEISDKTSGEEDILMYLAEIAEDEMKKT
ncbi:hypothetical protein ACFL6I_15470 [candidate division KSB1 bacterium]